MANNHLFSYSLLEQLFQHNLVSADGYVKATDQQLFEFREFLVEQARDRTAELYKKRKAMVDEVSRLVKEDYLTTHQTQKLILLLHELNLKITENGTLVSTELKAPVKRYLGSSEPNQSLWDRQVIASDKRLRILVRDLRELDEWLKRISTQDVKVLKYPTQSAEYYKKEETRYRERTAKRNKKMERARKLLIETYQTENAMHLKNILAPKEYRGRVGLKKKEAPPKKPRSEGHAQERRGSNDSFVTAASDMSFLEGGHVTSKEMDLAKHLFEKRHEKDSSALDKYISAEETVEAYAKDTDEAKRKPIEDERLFKSEPAVSSTEKETDFIDKDKKYKSEPILDSDASRNVNEEDGNESEDELEGEEPITDEKKFRSAAEVEGKEKAMDVPMEDKAFKSAPEVPARRTANQKAKKSKLDSADFGNKRKDTARLSQDNESNRTKANAKTLKSAARHESKEKANEPATEDKEYESSPAAAEEEEEEESIIDSAQSNSKQERDSMRVPKKTKIDSARVESKFKSSPLLVDEEKKIDSGTDEKMFKSDSGVGNEQKGSNRPTKRASISDRTGRKVESNRLNKNAVKDGIERGVRKSAAEGRRGRIPGIDDETNRIDSKRKDSDPNIRVKPSEFQTKASNTEEQSNLNGNKTRKDREGPEIESGEDEILNLVQQLSREVDLSTKSENSDKSKNKKDVSDNIIDNAVGKNTPKQDNTESDGNDENGTMESKFLTLDQQLSRESQIGYKKYNKGKRVYGKSKLDSKQSKGKRTPIDSGTVKEGTVSEPETENDKTDTKTDRSLNSGHQETTDDGEDQQLSKGRNTSLRNKSKIKQDKPKSKSNPANNSEKNLDESAALTLDEQLSRESSRGSKKFERKDSK